MKDIFNGSVYQSKVYYTLNDNLQLSPYDKRTGERLKGNAIVLEGYYNGYMNGNFHSYVEDNKDMIKIGVKKGIIEFNVIGKLYISLNNNVSTLEYYYRL